MILKEYTKEVLTEGIRFFKTSHRIERLIRYIKRKIDVEEIDTFVPIITKLEEIAEKFREVEMEYTSTKDKEKIKNTYMALEKEYSNLIKIINKEDILQLIKGSGIGTVVASIFFIMYSFFYTSGFSSEIIALNNYNPTGENIIRKSIKDLGSEETKRLGQVRRNAAIIASRFSNLNRSSSFASPLDEIGKDAKKYLEIEKEVSKVASLGVGVSAGGIAGLFIKLFGGKKNRVFNSVVSVMRKL